MKLLLPIVLPALLIGGAIFGWRAYDERRQRFTVEEKALIDDLVELYSVRVTRSSDPEAAKAVLDTLQLNFEATELEPQIERLSLDPLRATRVLQAVHDSLRARRDVFFGEAQGDNPGRLPGQQGRTDG